MATISTNADANLTAVPSIAEAQLLIHITSLAPETVEPALENLARALPDRALSVALPENVANLAGQPPSTLHLVPYAPAAVSSTNWLLTASDYVNTYKLAQEHHASACLVLGPDSHTMSPESLRNLAEAAATPEIDLAAAHYQTGPHEGLLNSALLYPVTRALFCAKPRFPLAIDLGLSLRMAERLATVAQRYIAAGQEDAVIWPVPEAILANYKIAEADVAERSLPVPTAGDLNALLNHLCGSLFADIDAKASFWQRMRSTVPRRNITEPAAPADTVDTTEIIQSFRLAYTNLLEIWGLVLPPQTMLGLKHLSLMEPASFRMPDSLWARIVYDFALAYRLRTLNRTHLMGALTPLYLAWVASHLTLVQSGVAPEQHIEELAANFETNKPYLVSRWRWPDRFNP